MCCDGGVPQAPAEIKVEIKARVLRWRRVREYSNFLLLTIPRNIWLYF